MQITGNRTQQARLTIRVSKNTLSFSVVDREAEHQLIYEPYTVKSGVSIAANLRQAFSESDLLQRGYTKVRVYIDSPILLVPIEEFHEEDLPVLYQHAFTGHNGDVILHKVQPNLNVVAVFPINKDLKMVVEDNFKDVRFTPIMQPIWNYLHQRSFTGIHRKLYAYFHDKKVDILLREEPLQVLQFIQGRPRQGCPLLHPLCMEASGHGPGTGRAACGRRRARQGLVPL